MASNDRTSASPAPKRRNLRLIILIVLVILAVGDGALLFFLHHSKSHGEPSGDLGAGSSVASASAHKAAPAAVVPPAQAPVVSEVAPSFDIVRVDPQGHAVLAGRAAPGAKIIVMDGKDVVGTVVADAQGEFVLLPATPLAPGMHEITLSETLPDGKTVKSAQSASINLPGNGGAALAVVSGPDGSRVMTGQGPQAGHLAMGAVDYDTHGHAIFSGTAPSGAAVELSLGGKLLGRAVADASGHWHLMAPTPTVPGIITLTGTIAGGAPLPSVNVPFAPEQLKAALVEGNVVIEPGDNLWVIARKVYGKGIMYTLIYSANAGAIHNPNLIFPGQDFVLPTK